MEGGSKFFTVHYSLFTFFSYICGMKGITTTIFTHLEKLPIVNNDNFFHSRELFAISAKTPRMKPYMVVCTDESGNVLSQLLAIVRYRATILPPFFFMHCRVLGEGVYTPSEWRKEDLFGEMLQAITKKMSNKMLYIEFSHLTQKTFGHKWFRQQGYFPVHWMSIHNSLHSRLPEERINEKMQQRIDRRTTRTSRPSPNYYVSTTGSSRNDISPTTNSS